MKKPSGHIENDVYDFVKEQLETVIKGKVYIEERAFNSKEEDAVISIIASTAEQIQSGMLNINIYVPDIDNIDYKKVKNKTRCDELELFMLELIESLSTKNEYKFKLKNNVQTFKEAEIEQHFVNTKLKFERITF